MSEEPASAEQPAGPARLLRSRSDRMIAGVCGGLAVHLGVDATLIRIGTVVLAFLSGGGVVLGYVIAWLLIPEGDERAGDRPGTGSDQARVILGAVFIAIGGLWLVGRLVPGLFELRAFGPILVIGLGVFLVVGASSRR